MPNENEYTELITGAHRDKPRFTEWVYQLTEPVLNARQDLAYMIKQYDLDLAEGTQLDAIGVRVGVTRQLKLRITDVFFAFDDVDGIGFDLGIWKTPRDDTYGITELSDEVYRVLLKAKIALNQYGGKNEALDDLLRLDVYKRQLPRRLLESPARLKSPCTTCQRKRLTAFRLL